jgi:hypothetical protein
VLQATRGIINNKKIIARKDHVCFSCGKTIPKGTKYQWDKVADLKKKTYEERRRHLDCPDTELLHKCYELEDFDLSVIKNRWVPRRKK